MMKLCCYFARVDWLLRCLESGNLIPWEPQDMIFASKATEKDFTDKYDRFGDQYNKVDRLLVLRRK